MSYFLIHILILKCHIINELSYLIKHPMFISRDNFSHIETRTQRNKNIDGDVYTLMNNFYFTKLSVSILHHLHRYHLRQQDPINN